LTRFIAWAEAFALTIGGPGLFLVALLDSSVLTLPEINDILVVLMVTRTPSLLVYYALMATAGSVAGCLLVFLAARKGGELMLRRKFRSDSVDRALAAFNRYGVAAVIVPAMLPPPVPLKLFVVTAGFAGMSATRLAAAVAVGRGLRYLALGALAYHFGDATLSYMRTNGKEAGLIAGGITAVTFALYYWFHRERPAASSGTKRAL